LGLECWRHSKSLHRIRAGSRSRQFRAARGGSDVQGREAHRVPAVRGGAPAQEQAHHLPVAALHGPVQRPLAPLVLRLRLLLEAGLGGLAGWPGGMGGDCSPQAGLLLRRSPSGRRLTEASPLLPRRRRRRPPRREAGEGWLEAQAASLAASGAPELVLILTDP